MLTKMVRKVVVKDSSSVADTRMIMGKYLKPEALLMSRDKNPEEYFHDSLSSLPLPKAGTINGNADLAEAWDTIYKNPAECLLVEGENKILTPWDLVVKPHLTACNSCTIRPCPSKAGQSLFLCRK